MDSVLGLGESEPFSSSFDELGYQSGYFIINMGSSFLFFLFEAVLISVALIVRRFFKNCSGLKKIAVSIVNATFYNGIFAFLNSLQIIILISSIIAV